jgi:carbon monoxide dehydrogenase subunit G
MKLSGEATIAAPVDRVYAALNDPAVLVRTIPGCQRLEQTGPDTFKATVSAGVASIKGTFDGDVRLSDQRPPDAMTLHASGAGAPGTVSAVAHVTLTESDGGTTLLRYDADATIGGVIGGVGQRMLTGVAKKTAAEFFAAVERDITGVPALVEQPPPVGAPIPVPAAIPAQVWTRPVPPADLSRQRMRDLLVGATFGAVVALLGVLLGALVSHW